MANLFKCAYLCTYMMLFVLIFVLVSGIDCWNPAFDVTPAELITGGIITEHGIFSPSELSEAIKQYL